MKLKYLMVRYRTKMVFTDGIKNATKKNSEFADDVLNALLGFIYDDDFGDLCEEDIQANELAINLGLENSRVVAKYNTCEDPIYIIAEKNSDSEIVITILFTHEY